MSIKNKKFVLNDNIEFEDLGEGVKRKILSYTDALMVVEVHFEEGSIGYLHEHFHEQITYVLDGEFEFEVSGEKQIVKKGDTIYMEPDCLHGAKCLKAGILLDIFTPMREDFVK